MRKLSAFAALLIGLVLIILGVVRLADANSQEETLQTQGAQDAPFTVVTEGVIDPEDDREEFTIEADGEYTVAIGRTYDIEAFIGDAAYNRIDSLSEGDDETAAHVHAEHIEGESEAPNPLNSDLWVATETTEGELLYRWTAPDESGDWSMVIFRDGTEAAPADIAVENPFTASSTSGIILLVSGGLVLLLAVGLFYVAARNRQPEAATRTAATATTAAAGTAAVPAATNAEESDAEDSAAEDRAQFADGAEDDVAEETENPAAADITEDPEPRQDGLPPFKGGGAAMIGGIALTALLAGSVTGAPPVQAATDEPTSVDQEAEEDSAEQDAGEDAEQDSEEPGIDTDTDIPEEGYSVLLNSQLERILEDIAQTAVTADEETDAEALESRFTGAALESRELAYRNHDLAETGLPQPIGTEILSAAVTSGEDFPRQAMVIVDHPEAQVPQILILEQEDARSNYRVAHVSTMAPGTEFPSISAEQGGVSQLSGDAEIGDITPESALTGAAGFLSDSSADFGDRMAESVYIDGLHEYYTELSEAAEDADVRFPDPSVDEETTALELPDGSTVVAGSFERVMQMAPLEDGDTIFLEHDLVVELVETDWTTFPAEITSKESVVLMIPADGSEDGVVLLGVHDIIEDASIETPEWFTGYDDN